MSIILTVQNLQNKLTSAKRVAVIDVRSNEAYKKSHLPGALFLDVSSDLTGEHHFFPSPEKLASTLSNLGISNDMAIVFYDDGNHRAASKAWFALNYLGHKEMYLLEGGFSRWTEVGYETEVAIPQHKSATYEANPQSDLVLTIDQLKERLLEKTSTLIDSRSNERFVGEIEPTYKKAGHIPGAKNFHSKHVFNEQGYWKDKRELQKHFTNLKEADEVIVSCGSGNSACMNAVALIEAGFKDVKLYPGGFSEWIEDDTNEIQRGEA